MAVGESPTDFCEDHATEDKAVGESPTDACEELQIVQLFVKDRGALQRVMTLLKHNLHILHICMNFLGIATSLGLATTNQC